MYHQGSPNLVVGRGEYFGKVWSQEFQGRSNYAMGGRSENFRSLGPTGAEIFTFKNPVTLTLYRQET